MSKPKLQKSNYDRKKEKIKEQRELLEYKRKVKIPLFIFLFLFGILIYFVVSAYVSYKNIYFKVGSYSISETEFNYYKNYIIASWLDTNEDNLESLGLDTSRDYSEQQYNDYWTWDEFFEYQTANLIQQSKIFTDSAKEEKFEFDTQSKYDEFKAELETASKESNISLSQYLKERFGIKATEEEIERIIKEQYLAFAYYESRKDQNIDLSDEDLLKYYYENATDYDSVDYRFFYLPTKELADEFELAITDENSFTELCIEYATDDEKEKYKDEQYSTGTNVTKNQLSDIFRSFLFSSREEGDTTVLYDDTTDSYVVLYFIRRYLDDYDVYSFRQLYITDNSKTSMSDIRKLWEESDKTEETFIDLVKKYSEDTDTKENGGLYEKKEYGTMNTQINDWLYGKARKIGDYGVISTSKGKSLIYITDVIEANWKETAKSNYNTNSFEEWFEEKVEEYSITDPNNNLKYLTDKEKDTEADS